MLQRDLEAGNFSLDMLKRTVQIKAAQDAVTAATTTVATTTTKAAVTTTTTKVGRKKREGGESLGCLGYLYQPIFLQDW